MEYRENVQSNMRQPELERNYYHIYIRGNYRKTTVPATDDEPEHTMWVYDEYYMPENEYYAICTGAMTDGWSDILRGVQREYLYDYADKMIMKYTTDAPDTVKRDLWVAYKHDVRDTQNAQSYPQSVTYPNTPE